MAALDGSKHSKPGSMDFLEATCSYFRHRGRLDAERHRYIGHNSRPPQKPKLGPVQQQIQALLLPSNGGKMQLITIAICQTLDAYHGQDKTQGNVPDFQAFWPGELNFERRMSFFDARDQESVENGHGSLNGRYITYFNLNEELEPNGYLKNALHLKAIPLHRTFWRGDVFVLKTGYRMIEKPRIPPNDAEGGSEPMEVDYDGEGTAIYTDVRPLSRFKRKSCTKKAKDA